MLELSRDLCGDCQFYEPQDSLSDTLWETWGVCNHPNLPTFHTVSSNTPIEALLENELFKLIENYIETNDSCFDDHPLKEKVDSVELAKSS